nr:hypothetical protein [Tanacetum cinerariifolium]
RDIVDLRELSHLVESSNKIFESDTESLREKLDLANEDCSLTVTDLLPHVVKKLILSDTFSALFAFLQKKAMLVSMAHAFEEVVGMGINLQLRGVKDYDPDSAESANLGVGVSSSYAKRASTIARSDPQGAMPASFPISLSSKRKEIMDSSVGGSKRKRLGFFSDRASSPILWGGVLGLLVSWLALRRVRMSTLSCSQRSESAATITRLEAKLLGVEDRSSVGKVVLVCDLKAENKKPVRDIVDLRELSHLVESSNKIFESDTESLRGRRTGFIGLLASSEEGEDVDAFLLEAKLLGVKDRSSVGKVVLVCDLKAKNKKPVRDIVDLRELSHLVESSNK